MCLAIRFCCSCIAYQRCQFEWKKGPPVQKKTPQKEQRRKIGSAWYLCSIIASEKACLCLSIKVTPRRRLHDSFTIGHTELIPSLNQDRIISLRVSNLRGSLKSTRSTLQSVRLSTISLGEKDSLWDEKDDTFWVGREPFTPLKLARLVSNESSVDLFVLERV